MARIAQEFIDERNIQKCLNCTKPECNNCVRGIRLDGTRTRAAKKDARDTEIKELKRKIKALEKDKKMLLKALENAEKRAHEKGRDEAFEEFRDRLKQAERMATARKMSRGGTIDAAG